MALCSAAPLYPSNIFCSLSCLLSRTLHIFSRPPWPGLPSQSSCLARSELLWPSPSLRSRPFLCPPSKRLCRFFFFFFSFHFARPSPGQDFGLCTVHACPCATRPAGPPGLRRGPGPARAAYIPRSWSSNEEVERTCPLVLLFFFPKLKFGLAPLFFGGGQKQQQITQIRTEAEPQWIVA